MYQCKTPDHTLGTCTEWVEVSIFGLPPITAEEASALLGAIALALVVAWGFRFVRSFIQPER